LGAANIIPEMEMKKSEYLIVQLKATFHVFPKGCRNDIPQPSRDKNEF
jgi:hypothetical protein